MSQTVKAFGENMFVGPGGAVRFDMCGLRAVRAALLLRPAVLIYVSKL